MHDLQGKYIAVNCWNSYFDHVSKMVLEHYDTEEYSNTVFVLGSYIFHPFNFFKDKYKNKKIIIYQMEQLFFSSDPLWHSVSKIIKRLKEAKNKGAEIWDMCSVNGAFLKQNKIIVDKIAPLKFTESLKELNLEAEPEIDLFFYGNINARRGKKLAELSYAFFHTGISVVSASNLDINLQKKYMERSKIILNIHGTDTFNRQEQPRIFYALINKKCVLSEPSQKNYFERAIIESKDFLSSAQFLLKNDEYKEQARKGHEIFKSSIKH